MKRAERIAWAVGIGGVIASALGWVFEPGLFPYAWVAAMMAWIGWPLGSMALLLVYGLTGGRWGEAAQPGFLMGMSTLPLLLPVVIPVLVLFPQLYPWIHPEFAAHLHNTWYLNLPFAIGRGTFYLVAWFGIAGLIVLRAPMVRLAPPALILLSVTVTFFAIDATLAMNPYFRSSVYGMLTAAEMGLFALSVAALLATFTASTEHLAEVGRLLLALVILWAYLEFVQLLIVWESDLMHEAPYYVARMFGFWGYIMAFAVLGHFLLPFLILVFPQMQRNRGAMAGLAGFLIAMHILHSWWSVIPFARRTITWVDVACMAAVFGIAAGIGLNMRLRSFVMNRVGGAEVLQNV